MGKIRVAVVITILILAVGGYYYYLSNKPVVQKEEDVTLTEVQKVLTRNLENDYPPTPKEVLKYYSEISKCYYNETYTDEELEQMVDQMRRLYDDELIAINPKEQYMNDVKLDIKKFTEAGHKLSSYSPSASTDVEYFNKDERECAKLYCIYTIREGSGYITSKEVFIMRKSLEDSHWKIYGFEVVNE